MQKKHPGKTDQCRACLLQIQVPFHVIIISSHNYVLLFSRLPQTLKFLLKLSIRLVRKFSLKLSIRHVRKFFLKLCIRLVRKFLLKLCIRLVRKFLLKLSIRLVRKFFLKLCIHLVRKFLVLEQQTRHSLLKEATQMLCVETGRCSSFKSPPFIQFQS